MLRVSASLRGEASLLRVSTTLHDIIPITQYFVILVQENGNPKTT
ncbi:MAG: hypothetical protein VSS75_028165 [Candidatus Parabeggiatoa sp.]|nr:hypothetical protein [Candidatus Parabeggiatoa sp.]